MRKSLLATVALSAVTATLPALALTAVPAHAGDGDVEKARSCGGFRIELKVGPEDGGWEVESDVDDASAGSDWRIVIRQDGRRSSTGSAPPDPAGTSRSTCAVPTPPGADSVPVPRAPRRQPGPRLLPEDHPALRPATSPQ